MKLFENLPILLSFVSDDVKLLPVGNKYELNNVKFNTKPCILHGNGLSKYVEFRSIGNYLAEKWMTDEGCKECDEGVINLESLSVSNVNRSPIIFMYG